MPLVGRALRSVFGTLLRVTPGKYHAAMIDMLQQRAPGISTTGSKSARLDYDGDPIIMMERGLRANSCSREPFTVDWIDEYVSRGEIVYDIGANVGAYTMIAAHRVGSEGKVYAFEPASHNYPILLDNLRHNGLLDRVIPVNFPLSGQSGLADLNYSSLRFGAALHAVGEARDHAGKPFEPVLVQPTLTASLDDLVQRYGFLRPNHIKIDVDGLELDILRGGRETLSEITAGSVIVEDAGRFTQEALYDCLDECGFRLLDRFEYPSGRIAAYYHLFGKGDVGRIPEAD